MDHHRLVADVYRITLLHVLNKEAGKECIRALFLVLPSAATFVALFGELGFHGGGKMLNRIIVEMRGLACRNLDCRGCHLVGKLGCACASGLSNRLWNMFWRLHGWPSVVAMAERSASKASNGTIQHFSPLSSSKLPRWPLRFL